MHPNLLDLSIVIQGPTTEWKGAQADHQTQYVSWYKLNLASLTLQQVQILGLFCMGCLIDLLTNPHLFWEDYQNLRNLPYGFDI